MLGAYVGAIENVETPELRLPIGQIAANEAQHQARSRALGGGSAIGKAFAPALPMRPCRTRWTSSRADDGEAAVHGERGGGGARDQPRHAAPLGPRGPHPVDARSRATGGSSPAAEIDRLRGDGQGTHISARNRFRATVTDVQVEGLMAQVELVVADPVRLVAIVTRDAVEELGLKEGMAATAIVKSTNVIIQS